MKTTKIYFVIIFLFLFIGNVKSQDYKTSNSTLFNYKIVNTSNLSYGQGYKVTKHSLFRNSDANYLFGIQEDNKSENFGNVSFAFTFNHIALSVKDVEKSAQFYNNILGLQEITNRTKMEGIRWFSFGEGKEIHLVSILKEPVIMNKAVHFALTTSNFEAFIKTLESKNINYSDWPGASNKINLRADGIKQIYFQDPDGYWIEVNNIEQK